jgi:16S rRNA (guanine966-N2)-methyltransferase
LFSSLGAAVEEASVLDLYAGTGALGIEALSRGARSAAFVESAHGALRAIRANLELTGFADRASVYGRDALAFLREGDERYDLALVDPPYGTEPETVNSLVEALSRRLAAPGWRAALTRPSKGYNPVIPVDWRVARELGYGDTLILVYQEV